MNRSFVSMLLLTVLPFYEGRALMFSLKSSEAPVWRNYSVYQPVVSGAVLLDTDNNDLNLRYNHCASTAFYQNRWFTVWNANTVEAEGQSGQLVYLSTSANFIDWSVPVPVFSTNSTCINPTGQNEQSLLMQWQPSLLTVSNELWCTWSETGQDTALRGAYLSKLTSATGRWENKKLLLPGDSGVLAVTPQVDGIVWRPFPSQNPVQLSTGRVLAPVTMRENSGTFNDAEKRNAVMITDDNGSTWSLSELIQLPVSPNGQWEPTVYELDSGEIAMIARRADLTNLTSATEILLFSTSPDKGKTWSEYEFIPLETIASRMHVLGTGGRFCMLDNDHRRGDTDKNNVDRYNLALFTSLSGRAYDWMPGVSLTHNLWGVAYPQMAEKDQSLYAVYSQGNSRSIYTARISPKPEPDCHYIYPRHRMNSRPEVRDGMLAFDYRQLIQSKWKIGSGISNLSVAAVITPRNPGVLLDGRADSKGIVLALHQVGENMALSCSISGLANGTYTMAATLPAGRPVYVGLSLWNGSRIRLHMNNTVEEFALPGIANISNGASLFFGTIQLTNSALKNYYGLIDQLLVFDRALEDGDHAVLQSGGSVTNGLQVLLNRDTCSGPDFVLEPDQTFEDTTYGNDVKRIRGQGSAAVEIKPFDLTATNIVNIRFEYKTSVPVTNIVLCTLGDATDPLRVELTAGGMIIARDKTGTIQEIVSHQADVYMPVELTVKKDSATVSVNGTTVSFPRAFNPGRFFLGQGYLEDRGSTTQALLYRISSVETRVY
ncbi:MAG: sialidase family protein [Kiritimatiellales bacterium]